MKHKKENLVYESANAKRVIKKAAFKETAAVSSSCWFAVLLRKGSTRVALLGLYTLPWTRLFLQ